VGVNTEESKPGENRTILFATFCCSIGSILIMHSLDGLVFVARYRVFLHACVALALVLRRSSPPLTPLSEFPLKMSRSTPAKKCPHCLEWIRGKHDCPEDPKKKQDQEDSMRSLQEIVRTSCALRIPLHTIGHA
jgi:hypothetical protein